ncbi:TspO/MBR family protein [Postechiella marina]|uniref:TspO/MBR family protein n=1 Tax=Postechiella marina TaxID=943941 RepID=UPI0031D53ED9
MKFLKYLTFFLIINFSALGVGSWLMENGPRTSWYINLNKAPWTPPGWVFGIAWFSIMVCFSIYMTYLYKATPNTKLKILFLLQLIFNILWNYLFFNKHFVFLGLACIILLTAIVGKLLFDYKNLLQSKSLLILPYFIWLCIATSLNLYIYIFN